MLIARDLAAQASDILDGKKYSTTVSINPAQEYTEDNPANLERHLISRTDLVEFLIVLA